MFPVEEFQSRVDKVTAEVSKLGLNALIILEDELSRPGRGRDSPSGNLRYLTNFYNPLQPPRPGAAIVTPGGVTLCVNPGFQGSSFKLANQVSWVKDMLSTRVGYWDHDLAQDIKVALHRTGLSGGKIGIDGLHQMTEPLSKSIRAALSDFELVERTGIVEKLRLVKSPVEFDAIREANRLADVGITAFMKTVKAGAPLDLSVNEAEYIAKAQGAQRGTYLLMGAGTPFIWGAQLGHGAQVYKKGDMVAAEFNAVFEGYYAQICRSFVVGKASAEQKRAYNAAVGAYREAASMLKPGIKASEINTALNKAIRTVGCEPVSYETIRRVGGGPVQVLTRGGHGIGLAMAENPNLGEDDNTEMERGFCVVIHPFVVLEEGGAIVGNTLWVTETGSEELNKAEFRLEV